MTGNICVRPSSQPCLVQNTVGCSTRGHCCDLPKGVVLTLIKFLSSAHLCQNCDNILQGIIKLLTDRITNILEHPVIKLSDNQQREHSWGKDQPLSLSDVEVTNLINRDFFTRDTYLESTLRKIIGLIRENCPISDCPSSMQHGMELRDDILDEDDQNDSGFGSGGPAFRSQWSRNTDLDVLERNIVELQQSGCYFGPLTSSTARQLLKQAPVGTFLIRDSSDTNFLYSLSVKTERGATSVRILYSKGLFQFDSDEKVRQRLPRFESVMSLVDFHTMLSQDGNNKTWRWEENSGKKTMKVVLTKPKKSSVSSLQHLSRVKINQCLENVHLPGLSVDRLPLLPVRLKDYLKEYPYRV